MKYILPESVSLLLIGSVNKQLGLERLPALQTAQQKLVLEGVDYDAKMTASRVSLCQVGKLALLPHR